MSRRDNLFLMGGGDLRATLLLVLAAVLFGTSNVLSKIALDDGLPVRTVVAGRFAIGAIFLWLIVAKRSGAAQVPRVKKIQLLLLGLGLVVQASSLNGALALIPAAAAALLLYTYPAITTVLARLLGWEPKNRMKLVALTLSLVGTALVLGAPLEALLPAGIVLALLAAVLLAVNSLISFRLIRAVDPAAACCYVMLGAAIGSLLLVLPEAGTVVSSLGGREIALLIGIGLTASGLGPVAQLVALRSLGPSRTAIGTTFEPLVTVVLAVILLGERLGSLQIMGGVMILLAIVLLPLIKVKVDPVAVSGLAVSAAVVAPRPALDRSAGDDKAP
jgi:drug/metabolite transporter (DMT)-like permease